MSYVLRTFDLSKSYKHKLVLDKVNISIEEGDIYGFVGENGSGKTTIIRLITGLIFADSGSFELFGVPSSSQKIHEARKRLSAIVESPSIYLNFSAKENLKMQSMVLGIDDEEKIRNVLAEVGLSSLYDDKKRAGDYSLGMRQRLGIAMALLGDPSFIILDEPMNGLDPAGIVEIRELILRLNREKNITFLISSHILTELSLVATKYGIISKGEIVKEITSAELDALCNHTTKIELDDKTKLYKAFEFGFEGATSISFTENGVCIVGDIDLTELIKRILDEGVRITSINTYHSSIEEYYLSLIGGKKNA